MGKEQGSKLPGDIISSMEATLQVGRERAARAHIANLEKAKSILNEASALIGFGLSAGEILALREQYETLCAREDQNPALKEAIQRIMGVPKVVQPEALAVRKEPKSRESIDELIDELKLKPGSIVQRVTEILKSCTENDSLTIGKAKKAGLKKSEFEVGIKHLTKRLKGKEIKIVNLNPARSQRGGSYFLSGIGVSETQVKKEVRAEERADINKKKKVKGRSDERPIESTLPSGKTIRGKQGKLHRILSEAPNQTLSQAQIHKKMFYGVERKHADSLISATAGELRKVIKPEGQDIISTKKRKGKLVQYTLKTGETSEVQKLASSKEKKEVKKSDSALAKAVDVPTGQEEPLAEDKSTSPRAEFVGEELLEETSETFEIAGFSRVHIAAIAGTLGKYREKIEPFLKRKGIKYIEEEILSSLYAMAEGEPAYDYIKKLGMDEESNKARSTILRNLRMAGFESARQFIESPDFESKLKEIEGNNPNIYLLLLNLSEIFAEIKTDFKDKSVSFIERLFTSSGIEYTADGSGMISVKKSESVVVSAQAEAVEAPVAAKPSIIDAARQVAERVFPLPRAIERRDPKIREAIRMHVIEVMRNTAFKDRMNPHAVNTEIQRLKKKFVDKAISEGWVDGVPDKHNIPKLDAADVAALLYLYDNDNLPSQLKKQVKEIALEEYRKASEVLNKRARVQKTSVEEVAEEEYQRIHRLSPTA